MTATCRVLDFVCQGQARELGLAQGAGVRDKIHGARRALADLEAFRLQQPRLLPYSLYRWLSEQRATRFLAGPLKRDFPAMGQRLAGIAEGSGLSAGAIYLFNVFEPLLSSVGGCTACPGACSAVAIRGSRSATGEPIVARNFDYLPLVQPFYVVRESRPHGKLRSFEFTTAPLAGTVDGMNEAGLCITYIYAFAFDEPPAPAAPISMAISGALECSRSVAEAAEFISSKPRFGGGLLMLCDAAGDIASLELSSTRASLRRPAAGEDILFHTNAFSSDPMRQVQVAWDAVYTERAPTPLRGRRLHQSSERRDERFRQLLGQIDAFTLDQLGAVMADHGPASIASDDTPCVHGAYWNTTACLQFLPKSRRLRVAYDTACNARFEEIEL